MKLLLISRDFPNIFGGVSDYTYHLSNALSKEGYEVYVLTSKDEKVIDDVGDNVKVLPVVARWNFRGLPQIIKEIKKLNPDWVLLQYVPHMYNHYAIPVYIALLSILLSIMRLKLATTFHEVAIRFDLKKPKYWGTAILQRLIAYTICIASYKVIVAIELYRRMIRIWNKKIYKIPIGSNILPIDVSDEEKIELRKKIGVDREIIICTFGSSARRNDLLLGVIKRLKEEIFSVKLLIIGGFPKDWIEIMKIKATELKINDAVYFTGFLKSEDVYMYLSISDIFMMIENIDERGWGGVSMKNTSIVSAFAAGLPIIGSKGDMTDEFFRHKENIILINSLNEEAIYKEIKELLAKPKIMEELKRGATRTFEAKLNWSIIAEKYIEVFHGKKVYPNGI